MIILVTGACGQLGHDVVNEISKRKITVIGTDIHKVTSLNIVANWDEYVQLDITDKEETSRVLSSIKPDAIIHCAAWTNVDSAEEIYNRQRVDEINVNGTRNLVESAKNNNSKFLYISTDYVFNGVGETPWKPDDKNFFPLNYYGKTKLEGEFVVSNTLEKFFIVRIAWAFGDNGKNFVKTMLSLAEKGCQEVRVVNDQIGTPTYTYDLARLLIDMVLTDKYGYYHATNEGGYISWYEFACEIYKSAGIKMTVIPVSTKEYGNSFVKRPFNSRLDKSKLKDCGFDSLPDWRYSLKKYIETIKTKQKNDK